MFRVAQHEFGRGASRRVTSCGRVLQVSFAKLAMEKAGSLSPPAGLGGNGIHLDGLAACGAGQSTTIKSAAGQRVPRECFRSWNTNISAGNGQRLPSCLELQIKSAQFNCPFVFDVRARVRLSPPHWSLRGFHSQMLEARPIYIEKGTLLSGSRDRYGNFTINCGYDAAKSLRN